VALGTVLLRRVYGLRFWIVPLCVLGLSIASMLWMPKRNKPFWIVAFALPVLLAFTIADTDELRAHPWLTFILVPVAFLATVFFGLVVGVNAGYLKSITQKPQTDAVQLRGNRW